MEDGAVEELLLTLLVMCLVAGGVALVVVWRVVRWVRRSTGLRRRVRSVQALTTGEIKQSLTMEFVAGEVALAPAKGSAGGKVSLLSRLEGSTSVALAALYIQSKQEDRAIAQYQRIISLRPENSTPYTLIGMLEDQRKNFDVAADNYRKALEKDPNSVIAANNLAWLYAVTGKGNLDEAVRLAQGAVQKNPNVAGFIDTLGWVYYKKNLHTAAVEQLRKAVSLNEAQSRATNSAPSAAYHYHLGMALKGKGDREESRRELETAIRLSDKAPFADLEDAKKALATL